MSESNSNAVSIELRRHEFRKASAEFLLEGFAQAWRREVTAAERAIVRSSVCCLSGMRLEIVQHALSVFPTPETADKEYRFLVTEVESCLAEVIESYKKDSRGRANPAAFPDLLSWEAALLGKDAGN